jgi:hypothetical protein
MSYVVTRYAITDNWRWQDGRGSIFMPEGAQILHLGHEDGRLMLSVLIHGAAETVGQEFFVVQESVGFRANLQEHVYAGHFVDGGNVFFMFFDSKHLRALVRTA